MFALNHKRPRNSFIVSVALAMLLAACQGQAPAPTLTATPPPTRTATATATATAVPSATATSAPAAATATPGAAGATGTPLATPPAGATVPAFVTEVTPGATVMEVGPFRRMAGIGGVLPGSAVDLHRTFDSQLWLLTDQAAARLEGSGWIVPLPALDGRQAVGIDDFGRVWAAAPDGSSIAVWDRGAWQTFGADLGWTPLPAGPGKPVLAGVQTDLNGPVWLATSSDVRLFDGQRWTVYGRTELDMQAATVAEAMPQFTVLVDPRGSDRLVAECDWIGPGPAGGGGVRWFDGAAWQGAGTPIGAGCASALAFGPNAEVWAGIDAAVWYGGPAVAEWTRFDPPAPPDGAARFGYVVDIAVAPDGAAWPQLALCGGASCGTGFARYALRDGQWQPVGAVSREPQMMVFGADGTPWQFADGVVYRVADTQVEAVGELTPLATVSEPRGRVWLAASNQGDVGLWMLERK